MDTISLDPRVEKRIQSWLDGPYDDKTKREIEHRLAADPQSLADAFFKDLSFGTGGMRGIMGIGTNRMNEYTVRAATQGLANYLKRWPKNHSVFIGYDVRHRSREFAEQTALVLSGNGIRALVSKEVCPTPLVSFACRHFGCSAGVMITASHNPPQYNGYKVYWSDGAQIVSPHDRGIMDETAKIQSPKQISIGFHFDEIGSELDAAYLAILKKGQLLPAMPLKIIYSNLHGTGIRLIPNALKVWGYTDLSLVEKQRPLDGNFSFAATPNPEEARALEMGCGQLVKEKGDLLMATDPDADRIGVAVLHKGKPVLLTGNQVACLCLYHICTAKPIPPNAVFVKTIVTTELFKKMAEYFGSRCIDVLTGFKYIGEQIRLMENTSFQFLFGAEESYGYLMGDFVRDKDAVSSACLIAEAAAIAKSQNRTLIDLLHRIYREFGLHRERLKTIAFNDSEAGMEQMASLMRNLRENPPSHINGQKILIEDYLTQSSQKLPRSDVIRFWLADGSKLVIRPSGTEPKVKIYAEVVGKADNEIESAISACDERLHALVKNFEELFS